MPRATHDGLTDLGNQSAFQDELRRATATALRYGEPLSVAVVDLDDFKLVNDRKGHRQGDRLLVDLARVLQQGGRRTGRSASAATSSRSSCRARTSTARRSDSTARDRRPPRSSAARR